MIMVLQTCKKENDTNELTKINNVENFHSFISCYCAE